MFAKCRFLVHCALSLTLVCSLQAAAYTPSSQAEQLPGTIAQSGRDEWEDEFPEERAGPEAQREFSPTLPSSSDVAYSHFKRAVRYLTGKYPKA